MTMTKMPAAIPVRLGLEAGGAPILWQRALSDALPPIRGLLGSESKVLEVGYGDGLLSCYLCSELGSYWTGVDIRREAQREAIENARRYGLQGRIRFDVCAPEETRRQTGHYDAVFIKTVLYTSHSLAEYGKWLDWIISVLKPGGCLVNFETGRANALTQLYRRIRGRSYTNLRLYTSSEERLYDDRFEILFRRYYGGVSQFLAPVPVLYRLASTLEEAVRTRDADNCFVVSIIGRPRSCDARGPR